MRKNGKAKVSYMHPKMEKYLDKSFGILVYQDDVLFTALELAGYDWNSVDKFRKAIGKKIPEEMAKQHEIFVEGCQKTSAMTKEEAEKLWDLFVPFQGYGFNKAHAASYGIVSYQTAYLKANYPVEYMTALLTAESGYTEKIVEAVDECKRLKIKVLGPDINKSDIGFSIEQEASSLEGQAIRFGFSAVKNVGEVAIKIILESRKREGEFKSFTDFCMKVDLQKVNRKVLESLIKAGAMDSFGNRASMLASIDKIRESGISVRKIKDLGQFSLFGEELSESHAHDSLVQLAEFEKEQKLEMEKELLGFYLTEHPKEKALGTLKTKTSHSLAELAMPEMHGQKVIAGGIIESMRVVVTKNNNQQMCFAKVTDLTKSVEIVVFPKVYALNPGMWKQDAVVIFAGKVELRESNQIDDETGEAIKEATVLIESANQYTGDETPVPTFNQYQGNSVSATQPKIEAVVRITVPKGLPSEKLVQLNTLLQNSKGTRKAELEFLQNGTAKVFPLPYTIDWSPESQKAVHSLLNGA
jgi:DNA polymerase-3 subunit alpha